MQGAGRWLLRRSNERRRSHRARRSVDWDPGIRSSPLSPGWGSAPQALIGRLAGQLELEKLAKFSSERRRVRGRMAGGNRLAPGGPRGGDPLAVRLHMVGDAARRAG